MNVGSISTYWGWLFAFTGIALLLQLATLAYCVKIYIEAALAGRHELASSSNQSSFAESSRSRTARQTLRRLKLVLVLQWRTWAIIMLAIFTCAFVCVVFIFLDNSLTISAFNNVDVLIPWILCLISTQDKDQCLQYTSPFIISQKTVEATLFILAFVGIEAFILMFRFDILRGWWRLLCTPLRGRKARLQSSHTLMTEKEKEEELRRGTAVWQSPRGAETENRRSIISALPVQRNEIQEEGAQV